MKVHRSFGIILCVIGAALSFTAASVRYIRTHNTISDLVIPLIYLAVALVCGALFTAIIRRKWGDKW